MISSIWKLIAHLWPVPKTHATRWLFAAPLLLSVAAPAGADTPGPGEMLHPRIHALSFHSQVLDKTKTYCAVLPEGYERDAHPWPVLFLFHGRGRHERSLVDDPGAREALLAAPFVTILPDGDDGWYINSPAKPKDRYQDYMDEVVTHATAQFNLSTDPRQRGLSGWSMGGYGCTRYALANTENFAALAPMIGLLDFPRTGLPKGQSYAVPLDRFGEDKETWLALNPLYQAESLRNMALCIITGDTAFDRTMNENFAARLTELGIQYDYHEVKGGHTFDVVREGLPIVVKFMTKTLSHP